MFKRSEVKDIYSLSPMQQGMLFHYIKEGESQSDVYFEQTVLSVNGEIDIRLFEKSFNQAIEKYDILRTVFTFQNPGIPRQIVLKKREARVDSRDISHLDQEAKSKFIHDFNKKDKQRGFNLKKDLPMRISIIKTGHRAYKITWSYHHIIMDGWCLWIVIKELLQVYQALKWGKPVQMEPETPYSVYIKWLQKKDKEKAREYWENYLQGYQQKAALPKNEKFLKTTKYKTGNYRFVIDNLLSEKLKKIAKMNGVTINSLFQTMWGILLQRYNNINDVVFGAVVSGRPYEIKGVEKIVGLFINTIPVRIRIEKEKISFSQLVKKVQHQEALSKPHEYLQLAEVQSNSSLKRDLLEHIMVFENYPVQEEVNDLNNRESLGFTIEGEASTHRTNYDFNIIVVPGNPIQIAFIFNSVVYDSDFIKRAAGHLKKVILQVTEKPDTDVSDIEIITTEEKQLILNEFNNTETDYPKDKTLDQLFAEQAEKTPGNIALAGPSQIKNRTSRTHMTYISYGQLNEKSNRLAHLLREKGVQSDTIAGIITEPSIDMITAILSILKAGGAYLPLDPKGPARRIAEIMTDSGARVLLTKTDIVEKYSFTFLQGLQSREARPIVTPPRPPITRLDELPIPDRSLVDYEKYNRYIGHTLVQDCISIQATRGCPFNCAYCHNLWPKRHMARTAENIFAEVQFNYNLGVRRFSFVDDIFNFNIKNSRRFFELIINSEMQIQLLFMMRGDILTTDYIDLMIKAGTVRIALALETASPRLQKKIGKNLNLEKLRRNIEYIAEKYPQVILELYTMHGFPTETKEEAMKTLDFIKSIRWIDFPYIFILKVYPNTQMEKIALENGVSIEAIKQSINLAYHEVPETLPFEKSFTSMVQADFLNSYFLSKERLLEKLPFQVKVLTEEELVQKYNSYLPVDIASLDDLLQFVGISREQLSIRGCMEKSRVFVPHLNAKYRQAFSSLSPQPQPAKNALKILLLDLSQDFNRESNQLNDLVEPPLGLMYLLTFLKRQWGDKINGKIAKSLIDFNSFRELKQLIEEFKPDLIGIRTLSYFMDFFHRAAAKIRQWGIQVPVVTGGPYATSGYRTLLRDKNIDVVVLGEGEITFKELIEKVIEKNGKLPDPGELEKIPGIAFIPRETSPEPFARQVILMDDFHETYTRERQGNPRQITQPGNMAYVIHTSGSTGKSKGVILEHRNVNYLLTGLKKRVYETETNAGKYLKVALLSPYIFDASVKQIFLALLLGHCLLVVPGELRTDALELLEFYRRESIDISDGTPTHLHMLCQGTGKANSETGVKCFLIGGESLSREIAADFFSTFKKNIPEILNVYGPTECCVDIATYEVTIDKIGQYEKIPIGKPMPNARVYILDRENQLLPVGVVGELYIGGRGVARGYLNNPDLTLERFPRYSAVFNRSYKSHMSYISHKSYIYRTGDLARWLADGNIQFLGRVDYQVKIRGYRIELEEIQHCLLKYKPIKEAVVLVKHDKTGDKYLCAYYVPGEPVNTESIMEYLAKELPGYMIPSRFEQVKQIPLTAAGKIDRQALTEPGTREAGSDYAPPQNESQHRLTEIWSDVLGIEKDNIGIDDNFFALGGHSLKATILIARVHKTFDVKITLDTIFKEPTIRAIAHVISQSEKNRFIQLEKVEEKKYYPLSFNQKRLWVIQRMEPDSTAYNMPGSLVLEYHVEEKQIYKTLRRLIDRHESFRTGFKEFDHEPVQFVIKEAKIPFRTIDISHLARKEKKQERNRIYKKETGTPFDLSCPPIFRSVLIKLAEEHYEFVYNRHHIITDGWSNTILRREFSQMYRGYRADKEVRLEPLQFQYKDFCQWHNKQLTNGAFREKSHQYWRKKLENGFPTLQLPVDFKGNRKHRTGAGWRCRIDKELKEKIKKLAEIHNTSLFMVVFSAYILILNRFSSQEDIVCSIIGAGRDHLSLQNIIGFFINAILFSIHVDVDKEENFHDFLLRVKHDVLETFQHQNYPPELVVDELEMKYPDIPVSFNMLNIPDITREEELAPFAPYHLDDVQDVKFDIETHFTEYRNGIDILWNYKRKVFKPETIEYSARQYLKLLAETAEDPGRPLKRFTHFVLEPGQIKGNRVKPANDFLEFNKKEIHQSAARRFEKQVRKYPDKIAVKSDARWLSYDTLNRYANRLAHAILGNYSDKYRLSGDEKTRYARQMLLHNWGAASQEKLKSTTVFAAGAGGSGSPLLMQLALTGIGTIIVCDHDTVDLSNLNRQVLHDHTRIGMNKALSAKITINRINPHVKVIAYPKKITRDNVLQMVGEAAIIFDNVDDMEAKFLLSQCAVQKQIPHIISSMIDLNAYVAIFHTPYTPCFHCLYDRDILKETADLEAVVENYQKNPNPVASPSLFLSTGFAVNEAIKIILGFENPAYNKYFLFNQRGTKEIVNTDGFQQITYPFTDHFKKICKSQGFDWEEGWRGNFVEELSIEPNPHCPACGPNSRGKLFPLDESTRILHEPGENENKNQNESRPIQAVALLFGHDIEMIAAVIGTLKSGKTYIPLDPYYPGERLTYMLENSGARLIVTNNEHFRLAKELRNNVNKNIPVINMNTIDKNVPDKNPGIDIKPQDPAYILYTSGSTGKPKGVIQDHRNVLHFARVYTNNLHIQPDDKLTLFSSYSFDAAKMDIYGALLNGAALYPYDIKKGDNLSRLPRWLRKEGITIYHSIPTVYRYFTDMLTADDRFKRLRFIVLGGEAVYKKDVGTYKRYFPDHCIFINGLGPTESTVTLQYFINKNTEITREAVPVGYPVQETEVFLIKKNNEETPVFEVGEIVFKSPYLALGYLGNRQKTDELFVTDPITGEGRVYRTGDLGRRLPDGSIEYVGRKDLQVKVRGFRIELEEIEGRLDKMEGIKKSVVVCQQRQHPKNENYLAAYYIKSKEKKPDENNLVRRLKESLPDYMIPDIFLCIEEFPMTPNGKIDRKSLSNPDASKLLSEIEYAAPRNEVEEKLAGIWREVLNLDRRNADLNTSRGKSAPGPGIDDNFFVLGGNSLRAIILTSKIHKTFHIKVPLTEIFRSPSIRELAAYIKKSKKDIHKEIKSVEKKEFYPQSSAQKRLFFLDRLETIGISYNMPRVYKVESKIDKAHCERTFNALIARHEVLRTSFHMINQQAVQKIHEPGEIKFAIECCDLSADEEKQETGDRRQTTDDRRQTTENKEQEIGGKTDTHPLLSDVIRQRQMSSGFIRPFDLSRAPLVRAGIVLLPGKENLFLFDIHHIIGDGNSMGILVEDFVRLYEGKELPALKIQYKEFSTWQNNLFETGKIKEQEDYWLGLYGDMQEIPRLKLPTDYPPANTFSFEGDSYEFTLGIDNSASLRTMAARFGTTIFMNLMAGLNVLLYKYTGQRDMIVGTGIMGRPHTDLEKIIGMFINSLPIRNYPEPGKTFLEFLEEVKKNALQAFENQDLQFETLVDKLKIERDVSKNPLFNILLMVQNYVRKEVESENLEFIPYRSPHSTSKFDLTILAYEGDNEIAFALEYSTNLFKRSAIEQMAAHYIEILKQAMENPHSKLKDFHITHQLETVKVEKIQEYENDFDF